MANTKSAEKAARPAEKHRARNVALRSRMRTAVRIRERRVTLRARCFSAWWAAFSADLVLATKSPL